VLTLSFDAADFPRIQHN